jgi:hypothetical protein
MAGISSVPPSGGSPPSNNLLLVPLYKKNGIGHGNIISDIQTPTQPTPPSSVDPTGQIGSKVDKKV